MEKEIERIIEKIPKYRNGSNAIPKGEVVVPLSAFISALTAQKEELKKMIEGKRIVVEEKEKGTYYAQHCNGYNQALDDIISELNHQ